VSPLARAVWVAAVLAAASSAAARLTPQREIGHRDLRLQELVPQSFGGWTAEPPQPGSQVLLVPNGVDEPEVAQTASYDDVLMRTYRRADGARVMVAFAYGGRQTQEVKIHRPELCYYAQGFAVLPLGPRTVRLSDSETAESLALLTQNRARVEVVTYWIRVGDELASGPWDLRWTIFREGLRGRVPDGLLVRVSSLTESAAGTEQELAVQHAFLADLHRESPASTRRFLAGAPQVAAL
jgi:EpsI family protein